MEFIYNNPKLLPRRRLLRNEPTEQEKMLWQFLKGSRLGYKFRRQYGIGPYIADFACPEKRILIELDGSQHFTEEGKEYDQERSSYLKSFDYKIIRFTNFEIMKNLDGVIMKIAECLSTTP